MTFPKLTETKGVKYLLQQYKTVTVEKYAKEKFFKLYLFTKPNSFQEAVSVTGSSSESNTPDKFPLFQQIQEGIQPFSPVDEILNIHHNIPCCQKWEQNGIKAFGLAGVPCGCTALFQ